jgi:hypothetical protein
MKVFYGLNDDTLLNRLKSRRISPKIFSIQNFNKFLQTLHHSPLEHVNLRLQTVHNYVTSLVTFLSWKVNGQGLQKLQPIYKAVQEVNFQVGRLKKGEIDRVAKALRLQNLPQINKILQYAHSELKSKIVAIKEIYSTASTLNKKSLQIMYENIRNYILVVMLVGIPPQRLQVFDQISIDSIQIRNKYIGMSIKHHKTSHKYGPVQVVLPPMYYEHFQLYLRVRTYLAQKECKSIFINKQGSSERYLNKIFTGLMYSKFNKRVSIRDCRSLYVTYMSKNLNLTQMHALSQQMFHSFQTQQEIYRSDDPFARAMKMLMHTDIVLQRIAIYEGPTVEEIDEEYASDHTVTNGCDDLSLTVDETFMNAQDDDLFSQALDEFESRK